MKRTSHKVFNRFLLVYLSLMLCTVLLLSIVSLSVRYIFRQESEYQFHTQANTATQAISSDILDLVASVRNISLNPNIAKLSSSWYSTLSDYERTELYTSCADLLSTVSSSLPYVFSIGFYCTDTDIELNSIWIEQDSAFLHALLQKDIPEHSSSASLVEYAQTLYLVVDSRNAPDRSPTIFYIRLHDELLVNALSDYSLYTEQSRMDIIDGCKALVTANGANYDATQPYKLQIYDNLYLYAYHDTSAADQISRTWEIFALVLLLAVTVICGFSIYVMYRSIHKPLQIMKKAMEHVRLKQWDTRISEQAYSEFDELYSGFNSMSSEISRYITVTQEQDRLLNQSELRQLQSQINPHFLYNCFYSLSQLCKMGDNETASALSQQLSAYYRYITRTGSLSTTFAEDYDHMNTYLQIQKIRFRDRVKFFIDEPDEQLRNMEFPKLILQPMVENSYKYVFERVAGTGALHLQLQRKPDVITITVTDSGTGLSEADIQRINEGIHNRQSLEYHGLNNICRRLELFFNGNADLTASATEKGGLSLTVRILLKGDKPQ